jgi:hypothetical protein
VQNSTTYRRESQLYVDIEAHENGEVYWSKPSNIALDSFPNFMPLALRLVECMGALGLLTPVGVRVAAEVWGSVEFIDREGPEEAADLTSQLVGRLNELDLPTDAATQGDVDMIFGHWQLPMYNLDFGEIAVPLDDLKAQQQAIFRSEFGSY